MSSRTASRVPMVDAISARIDTLQEGFRKLSKSATVVDLADRLAETVRRIIPDAVVDVAWRRDESAAFETISGGGEAAVKLFGRLSGEKFARSCTLSEERDGLLIVQKLADGSQAAMLVGARTGGAGFGEEDTLTLRVFIHFFEGAYQDMAFRKNEKSLVFSLNHRILQLNSLIETGIEVSKLDHREAPHHLAVVRAASLTNASRAAVTVTVGRSIEEEFTFPAGTRIDRSVSRMNSIVSSFTFLDRTYAFELFDKESRSGAAPFEETDHLLLDALARQVHASLENRYLHEQALEKQRIEQEMTVAATIQQKILPVSLPEVKGYDLAGVNIPSKSVGGDYYNCLPLQDGRFALVIADVAGKGVPAALLVSSFHSYLSAWLEGSFAITRLAARLNKVLYNESTADKFVTAFFAILTPETGDLECLSAGHNPMYVLRKDRTVRELHTGGLPLGTIDMDIPYNSERVTLERGERLFLYTDGVTEAENSDHVLYERDFPVTGFLSNNRPESSETFISDLIADIRRFTGTAPQNDDITAMYLRRE